MPAEDEFITITAVDRGSSDTMSRSFPTASNGVENEGLLKAMITEWEKEIPYRRYFLITQDIIEDFSEEIREVLEDLEVEE